MRSSRFAPTIFGLALVLMLAAIRLADPLPLQMMRDAAFDLYQRLAPREAVNLPVRIVDIDDAAIDAVGQWPWSRHVFASLTDRLTDMGAAAIGFDVLFAEPDRLSPDNIASTIPSFAGADLPDYDAEFAAALARGPTILGFSRSPTGRSSPQEPKGGFALSGTDPRPAIPSVDKAVVPLPELGDAASGLGGLSLTPSESVAVVRRAPLLWTANGKVFPALSLEALRIAQGEDNVVVLGETSAPFVESLRVGQLDVPTTPDGGLWLYYRHLTPDLTISAEDILGPNYRDQEEAIDGNIVLIGSSASGLNDMRGTPLEDMPGVAIHAQAIEQMMTGKFLTRSDWVQAIEVIAFVALGASIVFGVLWSGPTVGLVIGLATAAGLLAFCWSMFRGPGILIDPGFPLLGASIVYFAMIFARYATTDADRRKLRRAFGHYVAPTLLTQIEASGDKLQLGGEMRDMSVLFTDLRGFTPLSETLPPPELLNVLNTLFGALGECVTAEMGTIDKFVGDSLMAFWNAPVDVSDHALHACRTALAMRETLSRLNQHDAFALSANPVARTLRIGTGIATGDALVGNMGLKTRFDYSCIGETVNLASRLEGVSKLVGYDIVVARETREQAGALAFLPAGAVEVRGFSERVEIFILVGGPELAASSAFAELSELHRARDWPVCAKLAAEIEPGLAHFYEEAAKRPADFAAL
ncbi:Adenylate cyclase [Devosia sp. DBB001]|nr:Adenylate cyclase [Devosia sp. DBB001]